MPRRPHWSLYLLATLFLAAGLLHFLYPAPYLRMMPPALPAPRLLVLLSGAAEVAGGLGLLWPPTRRWAAWGLVALLLAVFPANRLVPNLAKMEKGHAARSEASRVVQ